MSCSRSRARRSSTSRLIRLAVALARVGAEETDGATAGPFGEVHRRIGVAHQGVGVVGVVREGAGADADGHDRFLLVQPERPGDGFDDLFGYRLGVQPQPDVGQDDQELVAAEPRHGVLLAHRVPDPLCHLAQEVVADGVTQGVVDLLEVIDIDEEDGDPACRGAGRWRSR